MNKATLKALQGSIRKWERIVLGTGDDQGIDNCPLCTRFYKDSEEPCVGCPVQEETKRSRCTATPYTNFIAAWHREHHELTGAPYEVVNNPQVIGPRTMQAAIAEHAFLVSLLP